MRLPLSSYMKIIVKYLYQNIVLYAMTQYRMITLYRLICTTLNCIV